MALLRAFTDDSGAETGDRRLFMAGYLHRADAWAEFSDDWHQELLAWPSIDYFKGSEANNLSGQFDRKKWDQHKRDAKVANLAAIIKHYQPLSFEFSINRKVFDEVLKPVSPYGLARPHFALCFGVVSGLVRYAVQQQIGFPIEFIFDEQDGVDADFRHFFSKMKETLPPNQQALIEGTPFFKSDRDKRYMPLQAADLLAWHIRREHETSKKIPRTRDLLCDSGHLVSEIPDEVLHKWADHHRQQPGISDTLTKPQWRKFRKSVKRLEDAGVSLDRVTRPGIYYPDNWGMFGRALEFAAACRGAADRDACGNAAGLRRVRLAGGGGAERHAGGDREEGRRGFGAGAGEAGRGQPARCARLLSAGDDGGADRGFRPRAAAAVEAAMERIASEAK